MLDSFWNSLDVSDVGSLDYLQAESYPNNEKLDTVLQKIDWVLLKLYRVRDNRKYDYDIVTGLKNGIKYNNESLTERGVEFLNSISKDLKDDSF